MTVKKKLEFSWKGVTNLQISEFTSPLNLSSKVSPLTLKVKELVGFLWNFSSMSELFTGVETPFESCPRGSEESLPNRQRRTISINLSKDLVAIYLGSILDPTTTQHAVPNPLSVTVIQASHSQFLPKNFHPFKVYAHRPVERGKLKHVVTTVCLEIKSSS